MTALPLIRRKLTPARLPVPYIPRPKLQTLLSLGLEPSRRLTLVSGGPGYGKSTLVAAYLQEVDAPACWVSLEEADADLTTFLSYVVGALQTRFPGLGSRALDLARSAPVLEAVLQTIVGLVAEELAEQAEEGGVLVLDDFHAVAHAPGVLQATEYLMQYLPDPWQLILTSREVPRLPLPQLRVRQQLVEVGVRELRFSAAELRELLRLLTGVELNDGEALELLGHTDGWVASVILAAQAVAGSGEAAKVLLLRELDQPAALYDYLAQEVFNRQTSEVQTFLLDSCLLPQVEPALCRAALGYEDATERIRALLAANLLLPDGDAAKPGALEGCVYHPSFRRFLRTRLEEARPAAELSALFARVGRALSAQQPEEALGLLLAGDDWDGALALVSDCAEGWLANQQLERLRLAIERFPDEAREAHYALCFYAAELQRLWGGFDQALGLFERATELASAAGRSREEGRARVHQAAIWLSRGDSRAEPLLASGTALLPEGDELGRGFAANLRGAWALTQNRTAEAIAAYEAALACYRRLGDPLGQAKVLNNLGLCHTRHGQFAAAVGTYREAIAQSELAGRLPHPMTLNNLASIHCYQGDFQQAWRAAERALELAQLFNTRRDALYAHLVLGSVHLGLADVRRAEEHFGACRDRALTLQDKLMAAKAYAGLAEAALAGGQLVRAQGLLESGLDQTGLPLEDPRQGDLAILLGLLKVEAGAFDEAQALLDRLEAEYRTLQFRYREAQVAFYQARLAERRGAPDAPARWEAATALATAQAFTHLITEESRHRGAGRPESAGALVSGERAREPLASAIRIRAFGELEVTVGERLVAHRDWRGFKTKLILAYLLMHPDGVTKEQLTDLLYGELDTSRTATLVLISRLRHALEPALDKQTPSRFVHFADGRYVFNFALPHGLDVAEFEYHCRRGADAALGLAERRGHWAQALGLYRGPFLAELTADGPWLTIERERLHRLAQEAHTATMRAALAEGDEAAALAAAEANLAFDACCELAHQVKLACLARAGQREAALRHYGVMKQVFNRELGSPPGPASQSIYQAISQGREPALAGI